MAGNVWEWVQDGNHDSYEGAPPAGGAWEDTLPVPANGGGCVSSFRVGRGGGFENSAAYVHAAIRDVVDPSSTFAGVGLRCCRTE